MKQTCFKCSKEKDLSEFYKHPAMTNGHLGKCKDCAKLDARIHSKTHAGRLSQKRRNAKPERKALIRARADAWNRKYPERYTAHNRLHAAVRDGKIIKPKLCEECGNSGRLHAHHADYSKPFDVEWLCVPCHGKRNPKYIED